MAEIKNNPEIGKSDTGDSKKPEASSKVKDAKSSELEPQEKPVKKDDKSDVGKGSGEQGVKGKNADNNKELTPL